MNAKPVKYAVKAFAHTKNGRVLETLILMPPAASRVDAEIFLEWLMKPQEDFGGLRQTMVNHYYTKFHDCNQVAFLIVESTL